MNDERQLSVDSPFIILRCFLVPASVSAATAAVASSTAATATSRAVLARPRFIDRKRATVDLLSIELGDSLISILGTHLHKGKAFGAAGVTVRDDLD
jgi:hypothetical protein